MTDSLLLEKLKGLEEHLCENILGQTEVVREIVPVLINGELGINSEGKPKSEPVVAGATGCRQNRDL